MVLDSMLLEVTRRCNMTCEHCARGDAQSLDMSKAVVDAALEGVEEIHHLTFSGGEPTLNMTAIEHFTRAAKARKINLGGAAIITNGKRPSFRVVKAMIDLYAMVDAVYGEADEMVSLEWSNDPFHTDQDVKEPKIYRALRFYHPRNTPEYLRQYDRYNSLINEGRARDNGLSNGRVHTLERICVEESLGDAFAEDSLRVDSTVYVSANGNVMQDCDCSFERIDAENIGNVLREPLETIIRRAWQRQEALTLT
jgi:hypothetical protein